MGRRSSGGLGRHGWAEVDRQDIQRATVVYSVNGVGKFKAAISADNDRFEDLELEGFDTLEAAKVAARKAVTKARKKHAIEVPVTFLNAEISSGWGGAQIRGERQEVGTIGLVHATFRGVKASVAYSSTPLLTLPDGSKIAAEHLGGAVLARRLDPAAVAEYERLGQAVRDAIAALGLFVDSRKVRPGELEKAAIKAKAEAAEAPQTEDPARV